MTARRKPMLRNNAQPRKVTTGGGAPIISAGATSIPDVYGDPSKGVTSQMTLGIGEPAQERGQEILQRVKDAIVKGPEDDDAVRLLGLLVARMPKTVLRIPELYDYLDHLAQHGNSGAVARIMGSYGRGRRRSNPFLLVGLIDLIIQREGVNVARAASRAKELYGAHSNLGSRHFENTYCRYKKLYDLYRQGHYLPASVLTDKPWVS